MTEPRVSFVMACFDARPWLHRSLPSMAAQTWRDLEIVLVDDGSTDGTAAELRAFAARDARVRLVFKHNTGLADSLNLGIALARGEWIARMDADDWAHPERLATQMACAEADAGCVYVGTGSALVDVDDRTLQTYVYPSGHDALLDNLLRMGRFPPHASALIRRSAFERVGGYRGRIRRAEDYDLWLRLSQVGRLTAVPQVLARITSRDDQLSRHGQGLSQWADALVALAAHHVRARGHGDPVSATPPQYAHFRRIVAQTPPAQRLQQRFLARKVVADAWRAAPEGRRLPAMWQAWRRLPQDRSLWQALLGAMGADGRTAWAQRCAAQWCREHGAPAP